MKNQGSLHIYYLWLIAVVLFSSTLGAQDPQPNQNAAILRRQFFDAYEHNEVEKGIELGLKADEAEPGDGIVQFNLARLYARSGNKEKATHWFITATRNGFVDVHSAMIDPDLTLIREEPDFKATILKLQQYRDYTGMEAAVVKLEPKDPVVVLPPGHDPQKPAPLLVLVHPTAPDAEGFSAIWKDAAAERGAIIVAPHAGYSYPMGGSEWGPSKEAEQIILKGIEYAKSKYKIDTQRVAIAGFSQGGNMALITGMRNAELFSGIIAHSADYDAWMAKAPTKFSKSAPLRVFLGAGDIDGMKDGMVQADIDYRHAGLPTRLVIYPNTGHGYPKDQPEEFNKALAWVWGAKP